MSANGCSLALNHAFVDGNTRVAHASLETFLVLNGHELRAEIDEAERTMLALAEGAMSREQRIAPANASALIGIPCSRTMALG